MDVFTAVILLAGGFTLGFGMMWAYCRFFRHAEQPTRESH